MALPDDTDDQHFGPDEVRAAIEALTGIEQYRIKKAAQICLIGTEYQDPGELINEAVLRSIGGGGRNWPKHVPFVAFMIKTIESLAEASRSSPAQAKTDRIDGLDQDLGPEAFLAAHGHANADVVEQAISLEDEQAHTARTIEDARAVDELFANDDDVTWIVMGLKDGQKASEIQSISGMSVDSSSKLSHRARPILSHLFVEEFGYSDVDKSTGISAS